MPDASRLRATLRIPVAHCVYCGHRAGVTALTCTAHSLLAMLDPHYGNDYPDEMPTVATVEDTQATRETGR